MKKFFLCLVMGILFFAPVAVTHAQFGDALNKLNDAVGDKSGTGLSKDLVGSISTVVKGILALVGTIFFLLTIYAGILWMTARGDEGKVEKSIDIIRAAIIGLIITLSAYAITFFVTARLGDGSGKNPNDTINPETPGCCMSRDETPVCAADTKLKDCSPNNAYWVKGVCPANCKK